MASNEGQFKGELVHAAREKGAHVTLISGSYLAGIPDIHVKYPGFKPVWIELKFATATKGGRYANRLTPLQRKWVRDYQKAGGEAAWLLCVAHGREWVLYGGQNPDVDRVDERHHLMVRDYGRKWDVSNILLTLGIPMEG